MSQISRRSFLAASALAGISATTATSAQAAEKKTVAKNGVQKAYKAGFEQNAVMTKTMEKDGLALTQTFNLGRSNLNQNRYITATHWGVHYVNVQGGKITSIDPFEHDYAPSINAHALIELPYSRARIRYPMVRESYLKDGISSREKRGSDRFVRVSWEKAYELVTKELTRVYDDYGPSAVFGFSYGWTQTSKINPSNTLLQRFLNLMGGFIPCENNYSYAATGQILQYVIGSGDPRSSSWETVLSDSQQVIFWGSDPIVTNDIDWTSTLHNAMGYLRALREKKNIKTIAINPLKPDTAEYLGSEWIAPKPGTDTAIMLGMIYELETAGKVDHKFLDTYTAGSKEFLAYVMGKSDGVAKTPAWAAKISGVKEETIKKLAHDCAAKRTMIMIGWGPQRALYGEQPHWMAYALSACLGQLGLPGGGVGCNYQYSNGGSPLATGPFIAGLSGSARPARRVKHPLNMAHAMPVARFADCFLNPGKTIDFNGNKVTYPDVKLVFWTGGNPFTHQPDTNKVRRAWKKPETVIVSDVVWTATARHADIVLPACTVFEHNDITNIGTYSNDGIVAMQKAIEPQYEAKSDFQIYSELSRLMGFEKEFNGGLDEMGWIRRSYETARKFGARMQVQLPTFEEFWEKGYVLYDVKEEDRRYTQLGDFRADPKKHALLTESGKVQLFSPKIASYGYDDCLGHPAYFEPIEGAVRPNAKYPLGLVACKSRYRLHSQLDNTTSHNFANIHDREPCWINPVDAEKRGIQSGDIVKVESARGKLLAGAYVTDRVMPGVVVVHHGAWYDPQKTEDGEVDVHGNSNTLTMDEPTSKLANGNVASTASVEVSRWTYDLPDVSVYHEPKMNRNR